MSSTKRGSMRDSHVSDYYVTPIGDIELFLKAFNKYVPMEWEELTILDPCAGGNQEEQDETGIMEIYHPMSYPTALKNVFGKDLNVHTIDIRLDSLADMVTDYTRCKLTYHPDIIITNPPFALATSIITKAMEDVRENGYVIMLLRLNFFGSSERETFFNNYMPEWCFVHRKRMSFVEKRDSQGYIEFNQEGKPKRGSTDSIEYAHFVFKKDKKPDYTKLVII